MDYLWLAKMKMKKMKKKISKSGKIEEKRIFEELKLDDDEEEKEDKNNNENKNGTIKDEKNDNTKVEKKHSKIEKEKIEGKNLKKIGKIKVNRDKIKNKMKNNKKN